MAPRALPVGEVHPAVAVFASLGFPLLCALSGLGGSDSQPTSTPRTGPGFAGPPLARVRNRLCLSPRAQCCDYRIFLMHVGYRHQSPRKLCLHLRLYSAHLLVWKVPLFSAVPPSLCSGADPDLSLVGHHLPQPVCGTRRPAATRPVLDWKGSGDRNRTDRRTFFIPLSGVLHGMLSESQGRPDLGRQTPPQTLSLRTQGTWDRAGRSHRFGQIERSRRGIFILGSL